ncbi:hypothetical protein F2Q69_00053059 [Brassica cretica]|uniref:Uncharacterized protein n=1 Tax=Brassica cretica TaxID=69181 RepID=A0A8S9N1M2_BRACR|nr:hypothetical protein F2Q69_00053059 [Brassica cretica]
MEEAAPENSALDVTPEADNTMDNQQEIDPAPAATTVEPVPTREYTPKVPYPVHSKKSQKDREETKCKKMLEDPTITSD